MFGRSLGRFCQSERVQVSGPFHPDEPQESRSPVPHAAAPSWCPGKSRVKSGNSQTQRSFFTVCVTLLLSLHTVVVEWFFFDSILHTVHNCKRLKYISSLP